MAKSLHVPVQPCQSANDPLTFQLTVPTSFQVIADFLWHPRWAQAHPVIHLAIRFLRYPYAILRDTFAGELNLRAMSLVYTTLLSIVPLLALSFSILKAFDFHYEMEPLLNNLLSPLGSEANKLTDRIMMFVENVKGTALGSVGLLLLMFTVISMVKKVEESFNYVWQVSKSRSLGRRFSDFFTVIVIAPILLLIAIGLIGTLSFDSITTKLVQYEWIAESTVWLSRWMPVLFIGAAFSFIYGFVPNTSVSLKAAIIGGLAGGVMWAVAGEVFASLVAGSAKFAAIYSTFAIMVVALIWLYLGWLILLMGAKVSFYVQHPNHLRFGRQVEHIGNSRREELALALMYEVANSYQQHGSQISLNEIAEHLGSSINILNPISTHLEHHGILMRSNANFLIPAIDVDKIYLHEIIDAVREPESRAPIPEPVGGVIKRINAAITAALEQHTLRDLLDAHNSTKAKTNPVVNNNKV